MLIPLGILSSAGAGGAAAGSYELIESAILTSNQSSVTFSSIPQDFKHLQIRAVARTDRSDAQIDAAHMRFNGDTANNYSRHQLEGEGSGSPSSGAVTSVDSIRNAFSFDGNTAPANSFGVGVIDILDYSSTAKNTTTRSLTGSVNLTFNRIALRSGGYFNTSAITSLVIFPQTGGGSNFLTGSRFSLYGIRGE